MQPLLDIQGLTVEFIARDARTTAVRDISLHIGRGEVVGVVGESGAGKSTIGAAIMDLLEPPGKVTAGVIRLNGKPLPLGDAKAMRQLRGSRIATVFQDPLTSLDPLFTVATQLSETLRHHHPTLSASAARDKSITLLEEVGVNDAARRADDYPHQFSGGMRQRVVIALALAGNPELLVADEPTTALDVSIQARILKLLRAQAAERGIGILLITHDMGVVAETADRVEIMRHGRIVESGAAANLLLRPQHPYSQALLAAVPPVDRKIHRFHITADDEADGEESKERRRRLQETWQRAPDGVLLSVEGVSKTFGKHWFFRTDAAPTINDVSFSIAAGDSFGLVGESGSGKTTIARLIAGLTTADCGNITFADKRWSAQKKRDASDSAMQMIFQDPYSSLNPRLRVGFTIAEPLLARQKNDEHLKERVRDMLVLVGLPPEAARKFPHEFSGGQRQRIAIARALITAPRLLICDEPTSALDVSIQAQILNLVKDLQEQLGLALLFISHDLPVVRQMCDRIGVLKNGSLLELRPTEELFTAPQTDYAAELLQLVPRISPTRLSADGASG